MGKLREKIQPDIVKSRAYTAENLRMSAFFVAKRFINTETNVTPSLGVTLMLCFSVVKQT